MRRLVDLILIVGVLAAFGFGAYTIGHRSDNEANSLAADNGNTTFLSTTVAATHVKKSNVTPIYVGVGLAAGAATLIVISLTGTLFRTRKREHWRA